MAINFNIRKAQVNPFVNTVNYNANPQTGIKNNFAAVQYNTNQPKAASDFPQEYFTAGYNLKAKCLDVSA